MIIVIAYAAVAAYFLFLLMESTRRNKRLQGADVRERVTTVIVFLTASAFWPLTLLIFWLTCYYDD